MIAALLCLVQAPVLDRWRESIELDLPSEVVEEGLPQVLSGDLAEDGQAIALVARALVATGAEQRAAKLLRDSKPSPATLAFVEVARARLALDEDDLAGARALLLSPDLTAPPVRHPSVPECWLLAGRTLARGGEIARAAPLLERFLALAPLDAEAPSAWHMLVSAAIERGDEAAAALLREKARASAQWTAFYRTRRLQARESPDEPLPRLGIAELLIAVGENARAREIGRDLVARFPGFCRGFEVLGRAERALRDLESARATLERGLACDASARASWLELARVLSDLGQAEAAAARYARYRELGGTEPLEAR